jgi:hypothetical protein
MSDAEEVRKYLNLDHVLAVAATAPERPRPVCPYGMCDGRGTIHKDHYAFTCKCHFRARADQMFADMVGAHDQGIKLATLAPSDKSEMPIALQEQCITTLKDDPTGNYAMFGPSGWSKTTFTTALYGHALDSWVESYGFGKGLVSDCPIIRIKAKTLLEQITKFTIEGGEDNRPPILARWVRLRKGKPNQFRLFLDELEKVKSTEFKMTELWDIVDALYEEGGQLVVSGNLKLEDLEDTNKFLEGFPRRIKEICEKHVWDFWKYEGAQEHE